MPPIARVVVDSALPHLDRPFDYLIPEALRATVTVGTRVRVPFAGRLLSAVVVDLVDAPAPGVTPARLRSAGATASFTPEALALATQVARRYGGSLWDVLRLMAPARVASLEARAWPKADAGAAAAGGADWAALAARWAEQAGTVSLWGTPAPRVVWQAPPSPLRDVLPSAALLAVAARRLASDPRGTVLLLVPDARCGQVLDAALGDAGLTAWTHRDGGDYVVLDHDAGATARYASYLGAMHGEVRLVIGTRSAALQPVPRLAGIVMWDDGSDIFQEPHAPYFHARTVAAMRASDPEVTLLLAAYAPSVDAVALVVHGFAQSVTESAGAAAPRVEVIDSDRRAQEPGSGRHWMPSLVWRDTVEAARTDPVAIVVPRAGYLTAVACAGCGEWPECRHCGGELALPGPGQDPRCRDCGAAHAHWHCATCHGAQLRAVRQGVEAIAEQVARMAGGIDVRVSSAASGVLRTDPGGAGIVVATPGALPAVEGGYARIVVVGADTVGQAGLGAELLALRWWMNAGALARSRAADGRMSVVGELLPAVRQALRSWDAWGAAQEAYAERSQLGLPPVRRALLLHGQARALEAAVRVEVGGVRLDRHPEVSVSLRGDEAVVLVTRARAQEVVDALREVMVERSKAGDTPLRLRVDAAL